MGPFNAFDAMANALWVLALCAVATTGRVFGLWRWLGEAWFAKIRPLVLWPYHAVLSWLARIRS